MAFHPDGGTHPVARQAGVRREDADNLSALATLVVAFACGISGLLMGLCIAVSPLRGLAFVFGAILAGGTVWFARDLMEALRR